MAAQRNRENQRRSRARRKDYIQELEQRLRHYEAEGVKATAEVQAAARKVSEENICLRSLLGICGVDNGRIEDFLRTGHVTSIANHWTPGTQFQVVDDVSPPKQGNVSGQNSFETAPRPQSVLHMGDCTKDEKHAMPISAREVAPITSIPSSFIPNNTCDQPTQQVLAAMSHSRAPDTSDTNTDAAKPCLPSASCETNAQCPTPNSEDQVPPFSTGDEISCLAAAEIIAGMRGHHNPEEVWSELGCSSSKRCMVKNMTIFDIMDQR